MAIKFIHKIKAFNRRKSVRLHISCLAKYNVAGQAKRVSTLTNLVNLSEGGALVVTFDTRLAPKAKIELQFQMPNMDRAIIAQGEVVQSHAKKKNVYQAGIQFLSLKEEDRQAIHSFISRFANQKRRTA